MCVFHASCFHDAGDVVGRPGATFIRDSLSADPGNLQSNDLTRSKFNRLHGVHGETDDGQRTAHSMVRMTTAALLDLLTLKIIFPAGENGLASSKVPRARWNHFLDQGN